MVYNPYQKCLKCGYKWKSRTYEPKMCPRCKGRKLEINHDLHGQVLIEKAKNRVASYFSELIREEFPHK